MPDWVAKWRFRITAAQTGMFQISPAIRDCQARSPLLNCCQIQLVGLVMTWLWLRAEWNSVWR